MKQRAYRYEIPARVSFLVQATNSADADKAAADVVGDVLADWDLNFPSDLDVCIAIGDCFPESIEETEDFAEGLWRPSKRGTLRDPVDDALRALQRCIYSLSGINKGENVGAESVKASLDEVMRMLRCYQAQAAPTPAAVPASAHDNVFPSAIVQPNSQETKLNLDRQAGTTETW